MKKLLDKFYPQIDYLRISLTDRCNLRCIYCLPRAGIMHRAQEEILTLEEISRLANVFASLGIKKIRLTGGEPLVRKGFMYLINSLVKIKDIEEVLLTTNGILLPFYAEGLKQAGIKRVNISLDTLNRHKFKSITGSNCINQVFQGIQKAKDIGFQPIKLNTVVMRGINDNEITDFVEFALANQLILRFIEFMEVTPLWRKDYYFPITEIKKICNSRFNLKKKNKLDSSPTEYYELENGNLLGFIKTAENNCKNCNRIRLTSTGELKICLYENGGLCLKEFLRSGASDGRIRELILTKMEIKEDVNYKTYKSSRHYMCNIGG